jgi:DNA repair exonuclease SbcCD nuclease subunit
MVKFAHIADAHLGYEQYRLPYRAAEFAEAFRRAVEISVREDVDFILISGDLFHQSRPSPETLKEAIEILSTPRDRGIPVFAIEGNHDRTQRRISAYHLLEGLGLLNLVGLREEGVENEHLKSRRLGNKFLVKGVFEKNGESIEIHGMRYMSAAWLEKNPLEGMFRPKGDAILMLHQGIKELVEEMMGVLPESQRDYFELKLGDLPKGYLYYALGHIHKNFETTYDIGKLVYPGSLQRWDFGDYETRYRWDGRAFKAREGTRKGFYIVEDWNPRFVELKVRPFVDIRIEADEETARRELERLGKKIPKEAFVRLDLKWERPFDVSAFYSLLPVRYLYVRTRFERKSRKGEKSGEVPKVEDYFLPIELKAIELTGVKKLGNVEGVIELFLEGEWEPKEDGTEGKAEEPREKAERAEKEAKKSPREHEEEKVREKKAPQKKGKDLLAWLGGER